MTDKTPLTYEEIHNKIETRMGELQAAADLLDGDSMIGSLIAACRSAYDGALEWFDNHVDDPDVLTKLHANSVRSAIDTLDDTEEMPTMLVCKEIGDWFDRFPDAANIVNAGNAAEVIDALIAAHGTDGYMALLGPGGVQYTADLSNPEDVARLRAQLAEPTCGGCHHPKSAHDETGVCAVCEAEVTVTEAMFGFQDEDRMAEQDATDEADSVARAEARADRDSLGE